MLIFIVIWVSQVFYLDKLTRQLSLRGVGPIFTAHLSDNLQAAAVRPFVLHTPEKDITLKPEQVAEWLESYHRSFTNRTEYRINPTALLESLNEFAPGFEIKPTDAQFGETNGVLTETTPSKVGQKLDLEGTEENIVQALIHNQSAASLAIVSVEPVLTLEKIRALGITSLLGEGTSNFTGSTNSRIHNINVGAKKMNNLILQPGETFSFVDHLGDVDASTGYLPELVIKGTKVIPEYGGGLCQVATTMFRAAIFAGLTIDERHNHSFAVHYYTPTGFDATIYPGAADLRYTNNTPGPILIQSWISGKKIAFDMFGSSDGRKVSMAGPFVLESNPDGSIKTTFSRSITLADGSVKKDSFYSNYKSPGLFEVIKNPLE